MHDKTGASIRELRRNLRMTQEEFALLKEQIAEVGFIKTPIVAEVEGADG